MKKVLIGILILILAIISTTLIFHTKYPKLDVYKWDTTNQILTLGEKRYHAEPVSNAAGIKLDRQIGIVEGVSDSDGDGGGNSKDSFRIWSIKGESKEERIAITGFMFPAEPYSRLK